MAFHTKLQRVQSHCVLGTTKYMDLLKFMINLDILYYLIIVIVIKFVIRLNILYVKKVVLQIVLTIILQESELIHMILYLLENINFS